MDSKTTVSASSMPFVRYNSAHSSSTGDLPGSVRDSTVSLVSLPVSRRYPRAVQVSAQLRNGKETYFDGAKAEESEESNDVKLPDEVIKLFEEKYQINVSLNGLYASGGASVVNDLVEYTNRYFGRIENSLTVFKFCCLARQKHKTLEVIGLLICDIEQIYNITEYFCFLTQDYEETFHRQVIGLDDDAHKISKVVNRMLKYSILPPIDSKFIKQDVYSVAEDMSSVVLELISYLIQRLLVFTSLKHNKSLLKSLTDALKSADLHRKTNFEITQKLEQWLLENSTCSRCNKDIFIQPCIQELQTRKKWHMNCCVCSVCNEQLFPDSLMYAVLEQSDTIKCSSCNFADQENQALVFNQFSRISLKQQCVSLLKMKMLATVQELEDDNYGYICQEWIKYWRMDAEDLQKYDRNTQKAQSAIFELIHRQQFFVDTAADFLKMGEKFLIDARDRPDELDYKLYDIIFKPVKELRKIHKRLLLSPMTRFLSDQGMVIKNQIFKLYLNWINKSYYAYEEYLVKLAESELLQDLDKMKEVPHLQNWIKDQKSAKLEKLLSGEFYYQIIQTKEIFKSLEKYMDQHDPENNIVFQTSMLIDKYSYQLHAVLDRAVTRAYISRIQNLEVKRSDVHYKKHAFVKYKSKVTNEVVDCCLILLNMCLVITKLSLADATFIKFAPLIYVDNLEYERIDAKLFISDKTKKDLEPYKVHFRSQDDAINWITINM